MACVRTRLAGVGVLVLAGWAACGTRAAEPAGEGAAGQNTIEVREGDSWTKVTVIGKEGRQTQVRYDDGTEEWVTADRIKSKDSPASPAAGTGSGKPAKSAFAANDAVETKGPFGWNAATVVRVQRGWVLIKANRDELYWVEPWSIRVPGAAYDLPRVVEHRRAMAGESAPTEPPSAPPKGAVGNNAVAAGADPTMGVTLAGPFTSFDYDGAADPQPATGPVSLSFSPGRAASEFASCTIRPNYNRLDSVVLCLDAPGTAFVQFGLFMEDPAEISRVDTNTVRPIERRVFDPAKQRITGAAEGGSTLLTVPNEFWPKTMYLWKLTGKTYVLKEAYQPLVKADRTIVRATLLDATHALVSDTKDEMAVLDLEKKKAVGCVKIRSQTLPYIHPSGKLIGCVTAAGPVTLLRPGDFSIVAEFTDAAGKGPISVDAAGNCAAYLTAANVVRVAKIADNSTVGSFSLPGTSPTSLHLLGSDYLMVDSKTVYDARTGVPIWIYNTPNGTILTPLANGQMLLAAMEDGQVAACVATLPDSAAKNITKTASKDSFLVRPGTKVSVEGDFGAYGNETEQAKANVLEAIKAAGLVYSEEQQPIRLRLNIAPGQPEERVVGYDRWGPRLSERIMAPCNIATLTLSNNGQPVWAQEIRYQIGGMVKVEQGQTMQQLAIDAAKINAAGLKQLVLPPYLPAGATLGSPAALGQSSLSIRGFVPTPKTAPQTPQTPPAPTIPAPHRRAKPSGLST